MCLSVFWFWDPGTGLSVLRVIPGDAWGTLWGVDQAMVGPVQDKLPITVPWQQRFFFKRKETKK